MPASKSWMSRKIQKMTTDNSTKVLLKSIRQIRNATNHLSDDLQLPGRSRMIADLSILYGVIFPHKANDPSSNSIVSPNSCSNTTLSIYESMGTTSPIEICLPPATIVEMVASLQQESDHYSKLASKGEIVTELNSVRDKIDTMDSIEISRFLRTIPNGKHHEGLKNLARICASHHYRSCSETIGKDELIEAHRRSRPLRTRLMEVFQNGRTRNRDESLAHFEIRNWADSENLSLPFGYSKIIANSENPNFLFTGPVPTQKKISTQDSAILLEYQRNFVVPFLHLTLESEARISETSKRTQHKILSVNMLESLCDAVLLNVPDGLNKSSLLNIQIEAIMTVTAEIARLKNIEKKSKFDLQKDKDELMEKMKTTSTIKDEFKSHSEQLSAAAQSMFELMPELNDDEILDEFDIKEMRDKSAKGVGLG